MVCKMKDKLTEENSIDIYEATVNSLALRALCIACYRIAIGYPCRNAKKQIKDKIDEYFDLYDLNKIERDALDKGTLMLLPFIKAKLIVPIIIASKIRSKRR